MGARLKVTGFYLHVKKPDSLVDKGRNFFSHYNRDMIKKGLDGGIEEKPALLGGDVRIVSCKSQMVHPNSFVLSNLEFSLIL